MANMLSGAKGTLYPTFAIGDKGLQVTLDMSSVGTPYSLVFPSAQGTGFVTNDGSGNLSFTTQMSMSDILAFAAAHG